MFIAIFFKKDRYLEPASHFVSGYCKEIIKEDNEESVIGDLADKLLKVMENLPALDLSKPEQKNMQGKVSLFLVVSNEGN